MSCSSPTARTSEVTDSFFRPEGHARRGSLVEDLSGADVVFLQREVVDHQLAVDDGDANVFARLRPQRRIANAVDVPTDTAVPQHGRFQCVFAVNRWLGLRLGSQDGWYQERTCDVGEATHARKDTPIRAFEMVKGANHLS